MPELQGLHHDPSPFPLLFTQLTCTSSNVAPELSAKLLSLFNYKLFCGHFGPFEKTLYISEFTQGKEGHANKKLPLDVMVDGWF